MTAGPKALFSRSAGSYDDYSVVQKASGDHLLETFVTPFDGDTILDLGCGTGEWTLALSHRFPKAMITGIDFSEEMVRKASLRTHERLTFERADILSYSPTRHVDLIVSNAALQWCQPLEPVIARYASALNKGGCMAVAMFGPSTYPELKAVMQVVLGEAVLLSADHFATLDQVRASFSAHLTAIEVHRLRVTQVFGDLLSLLRQIQKTGTRGQPGSTKKPWTPGFIHLLSEQYLKDYGQFIASSELFFIKGYR